MKENYWVICGFLLFCVLVIAGIVSTIKAFCNDTLEDYKKDLVRRTKDGHVVISKKIGIEEYFLKVERVEAYWEHNKGMSSFIKLKDEDDIEDIDISQS